LPHAARPRKLKEYIIRFDESKLIKI